jgi:hypothetical protein
MAGILAFYVGQFHFVGTFLFLMEVPTLRRDVAILPGTSWEGNSLKHEVF